MRKLCLVLIIAAAPALIYCSDDDVDPSKDPDKGVAGDMTVTEDQGAKDVAAQDLAGAPDQTKVDAGPPQKVEHYAPADNAAGSWVEDTSVGVPGVEAGYTTGEIEGIINGAHDAYRDEGCKGFVKQDYKIGDMTLQLYLWDMDTEAGALKMFNENKTKGEDYEGLTFEAVADVPDQAIIASDALVLKAYLVKNNYIAKISARCMNSADLASLKTSTVEFITYLAGQLP